MEKMHICKYVEFGIDYEIVKIDYELMKIGNNSWNCLQTGVFVKSFWSMVKFGENRWKLQTWK